MDTTEDSKTKPKERTPTGFASCVERFGRITVHPKLDPSGLYTDRAELASDPCYYHPQPLHIIFEVNRYRKGDKDPWKYKSELEEWAENLGYRNQKILEQRRWQRSVLGPAWHEIEEPPLGRRQYGERPCNNVGFGRTSRLKPPKNNYPGPGTYFKANPYKVPYGPHSTRPTFEREEPCRFKPDPRKWLLACNRYKIKDKDSIEEKPNKVVSLFGPYNLFTGKRDGPVRNHFNKTRLSAATWPYTMKGCLETYKKTQFGVMNKTGRDVPSMGRLTLVDISMCLRRPGEPDPGSYNVEKPREFKQNKRAFNSTYDKGPGYRRTVVWPGVGRYKCKALTCGILGQGHRHVFLSKQSRTIGAVMPQPMNTF